MRFGVVAENLLERIGLASGMVPEPMLEGYGSAFARALTVGVELGVFEALADEPMPADVLSQRCATDLRATEKLLNLLVGARYMQRAADGTYRLTKRSRRWLLERSRQSVRDMVLMKSLEWRWIDELEAFVRTGRPLDVHATMTADDWRLYQRGMRAQAGLAASWLVRRLKLPEGATAMLDIGGSHGYFSVALCRKYPQLRAVVLDLPPAVAEAAPLLVAEGMGDRVVHRAGDVLSDHLGAEAYDLILAFSLVHHFDADTNRRLTTRCAAALRPGGIYVIGDLVRPESPRGASAMDLFYDLYFALTSRSGLWSTDEMAEWQRSAGLVPRQPDAPDHGPRARAAGGRASGVGRREIRPKMPASMTMTVTIARPVADVFAVLSDVENVPKWSPNTIEETLLTPGPLRKGSRRRAVIKGFAGRTMQNEAEMIEFEQDRRMVIDVRDAPVPARIVIDFTPVDGGTRLDWTGIVSPRGILAPTAPLIARLYRMLFERDLRNLKALMERGDL